MGPIPMLLLLVVSLSLFAWSAVRRWRLMMVAERPEARFDQTGERIRGVLQYMFGQARMPRYPLAGWAHIAVFFGFMVLLLNSIMLWVRGFAGHGSGAYNLWVFGLDQPLGMIYAFLRDTFIVAVLIGVVIFFYNRAVVRLARLTLNTEGLLILGIIFTMMIADLVYEGVEINAPADLGGQGGRFLAAMPFASITAAILRAFPGHTQHFLWQLGFWTHSALVLIFLNLLPYGKHFHVLTVLPNIYFRQLTPRGRLTPIPDIEGKLEREETLGVKRVQNLSWKDVLDFYTCTECGRCSDNCPATRTGKLLSPKHLLLGLRDHMYLRERQLTGTVGPKTIEDRPAEVGQVEGAETVPAATVEANPPYEGEPPGPPHGTRAHADADAAAAVLNVAELTPAWINPSVLWACTTCAACEEECPVFITYIDKIVGVRRNLVMERGEFPEQLQTAFQGLERAGNPYSYPNEQRAEWAAGLDVPLMAEVAAAEQPSGSEAAGARAAPAGGIEYLYWVGCAASFDDRSRKIARAFAQLMKAGGVRFAILGPEETCNGDPARRAGNEYLFQTLATQNVETLNRYSVKRIVTTCPHCYNTLKNEYPDFGGHFDVIHHSELLASLVRSGRLKPRTRVDAKIVFHDACYLGRHNGVYDPPREILAAIPGIRLAEVSQSRDRGMCCGAGGAQMWKEEEAGTSRVNHARVGQLLAGLPGGNGGTIASACPFCKTMLSDGLADKGHEAVGQLDVAELLWQAVQGETANGVTTSASAPAAG